jgi:hypothetical protein
MLYALARSLPDRSFTGSVVAARFLIAATIGTWPGLLLAVWVLLTGIIVPVFFGELELWLYFIAVFVLVSRSTSPAADLEQLEVPYSQLAHWKRTSWWVVAVTFIVVPFVLVVWSYV